MLPVEVALPLSSPTYTVSRTGVRHGASLRVGECPDQAGFSHPPRQRHHPGEPWKQISSREPLKLEPKPETTRRRRRIEAAR